MVAHSTDGASESGDFDRRRAARLERQLATAQEITHIGSWEWDLATNQVTWSDELYRIYGLRPQSCEVTFETFLARVHPEDREHTAGKVREALASGGHFSYLERILRADGAVRWLESVGEVARDEGGRIVGLIGTCRDVTAERERDAKLRLFADIVHNVQISLSVWSVGDSESPRLVAHNPAAERRWSPVMGARLGSTFAEIFPDAGEVVPDLLREVARRGAASEIAEYSFTTTSGESRVLALKAFPLPECVGLAAEDITEAIRARRLEEGEQRIFEMIASGAPLTGVLECIARYVEEQAPGMLASILLLDDDAVHISVGAGPNLPPEYNAAIEGAPIGPRAGSCGTAMYLKRPVYVLDIDTDPLWEDYKALVRPYGLRACWSTPVIANDGRVLGTFALYYRQCREPDEASKNLIARATRITSIAIERRQLEDELRSLSEHVESVREDERTGIAREIHDELGQCLTALKMDLAWLGRRADAADSVPSAFLREQVKTMSGMTDSLIAQVRRISADLRPGVLDDLGLAAAVEWQVQEFERRTQTRCVLRSNVGEAPLDQSVATAVFRILQEALTNVTRHASAHRVDVTLERRDHALRLEIRDDGLGIPPEAITSRKSLGLIGMRERARRFGGTLTVAPAAHGGTLLELLVPLGKGGDAT